jgi:hypothetical protein
MLRAKAFFYVCAGLLLLAVSYQLGTRAASAQASAAPEVAVLSGSVTDGGTIPLPHYADGAEALESECHWTVSPQTLSMGIASAVPIFERCSTSGRVVRVYWCRSGCGPGGDCATTPPDCPGPMAGTANYMIVATRIMGPVSVERQSFGQLKARFREPAQRQSR